MDRKHWGERVPGVSIEGIQAFIKNFDISNLWKFQLDRFI